MPGGISRDTDTLLTKLAEKVGGDTVTTLSINSLRNPGKSSFTRDYVHPSFFLKKGLDDFR